MTLGMIGLVLGTGLHLAAFISACVWAPRWVAVAFLLYWLALLLEIVRPQVIRAVDGVRGVSCGVVICDCGCKFVLLSVWGWAVHWHFGTCDNPQGTQSAK